MRIVFLATHSLESPGGGGRFYPLAKALVNKGHQVTMITLHHDYANVEQKQFVQGGVVIKYVGQMHVHKTAEGKTYFKPWKLLWVTAVSTIRLTWATLRTPCDVVQICKAQPMNGAAAWIVHLLKRKPVYLDSDDLEAVNNRFSGRWQQKIVAWFENWIPSFVEGITVNTSFIKKHYADLGYPIERIVSVPNGVDRERFDVVNKPGFAKEVQELRQTLQIGADTPVVTYVGSISLVSHAVDLLLEAFVDVRRRIPDAMLLLVGSGEDLAGLQRLAAQLGVINAVRFTGRVSMDKIPYYFRLGRASVDPLRNTAAAESSFSLKLAESLASGVPCVTTDIGDRKSLVGQAGIAVPPGEAPALAHGIITVLSYPDIAQKLCQAAWQMRGQLWWDTRVDIYLRLYSGAIDGAAENASDH